MANKHLFHASPPPLPRADAINEAGGLAYRLPPKQALAQLAATGSFHGTYYANGEAQLADLIALASQIDDHLYLAKLAVYARQKAFMKDMPVALLLLLSKCNTELFHRAFDKVVDNGRTLRTFVQMLRSGVFGRRTLSYSLQRAVQRWLNEAKVTQLLHAAIGQDPSLRDVFRLARPTPPDNTRRALYGWLTDKPIENWGPANPADLPVEVQALIAFRQATSEEEQLAVLAEHRFRWDLLADSARGPNVWKAMARQMGPQALRMNLNTLARHGVLDDPHMVAYVAERIADPEEVRRSRQFPYQYFAAYRNASSVDATICTALERAAELACGNVPKLPGPVVIGVDVSGSMNSPVTGYRGGGTSAMRCIDVAALFAAAMLRQNRGSLVVPFDHTTYKYRADPTTPILRMADELARFGGGGTDCSLPLQVAVRNKGAFAGCVLISDTESWIGQGHYGSTATLTAWEQFGAQQRKLLGGDVHPKLICINLQPYGTTQAPERADILNVAGFSDAVFQVIAAFLDDAYDRFVSEVEAVEV